VSDEYQWTEKDMMALGVCVDCYAKGEQWCLCEPPKPPVTSEYVRYIEDFIVENQLYDAE
jgi:hypothetical protein